jgi:subtilisin family serine protease
VANDVGEITDAALLCGLEWSARKSSKLEVVNMSLSGVNAMAPCYSRHQFRSNPFLSANRDRIHQRICRLNDRGVTVVAAAGNSAMDASTVSPAAYPEVITVSAFADFDGQPGGLVSVTPPICPASERDDVFATFSNFGAPVDISAPGVCIRSTAPGAGVYPLVDGTSFAAPLVAGAAALTYHKTPTITPAKVRSRLLATAEAGPIAGDPDSLPEGVLNVSTF